MTKNKIISIALSAVLICSMIPFTAFSTFAATNDIDSSGGSGKTKVTADIQPAIFNVTVPYVLPISIDKDQNVYVADNMYISNNGNGPVCVVSAEVEPTNQWELVDSSVDFKSTPVNSKKITLEMQNNEVATSGVLNPEIFETINGNSKLNIQYDADAAVQGEAISEDRVADILFTIDWDKDTSGDTIDKKSLNTFLKNKKVKTFQKASESLNIDDVVADENMTRIDGSSVALSGASLNACTSGGSNEPAIYAYVDSNQNGYWWSNATRVYLPSDCSYMFQNSTLTSIDLSNIDTSNVVNMYRMFYGCNKVTALDLSNFDTSNVKDISGMFQGCQKLTSLDLSSFDTSNVKNMGGMFRECQELTSLDLSSFDTGNVKYMDYMFANCSHLTSLDLSNFNTGNVTDMSHMFNRCGRLTSLNLSNFDTSNVTDMGYMFEACVGLASLDLSSFDTSNVTDMLKLFYNCRALKHIDLSGFNTSNITDMSNMFSGCNALEELDLSSFDTSNVTNMSHMFDASSHGPNLSSLTSLNLSSFNTSNVTNMSCMFAGCSALQELDLSNFDTTNVTDMSYMFGRTVNDGGEYFCRVGCKSLKSLDLSSFDTCKVNDMKYMFAGCSSLSSLNLSNFNTERVREMSFMFYNCTNLSDINLSSFNAFNVNGVNSMFAGCSSLVSLDLSNFTPRLITNAHLMFADCTNLTKIFVSTFNFDNWWTEMYPFPKNVFRNCYNIIGQNGTIYDENNTDGTYARIDAADAPGYFTYKAA